MKKIICIFSTMALLITNISLVTLFGSTEVFAEGTRAISQTILPQVEAWPSHPSPYAAFDWKQRAIDFDNFMFDWGKPAQSTRPTIRWDNTHYNMDSTTYGVPAYYGDQRFFIDGQYDAIGQIASIVGSSLCGADKSNFPLYPGDPNSQRVNYVDMLRTFYDDSVKLVYDAPICSVNNYAFGSFWYDISPSFLYYMVGDLYPTQYKMNYMLGNVANTLNDMLVNLGGSNLNMHHIAYNFKTNTPIDKAYMDNFGSGEVYPKDKISPRWDECEAALIAGTTQYWAYEKFGDSKYLDGAKWCLDFFDKMESFIPTYEWALHLGPYLAARMNAEQGTSYDTMRYFDWLTKLSDANFADYGTIQKNVNGFDLYGLEGGTGVWDGYGFATETFSNAFLAPAVKYDHRLAKMVGKWLLNVSNSARFLYPDGLPAANQYYGSTYIHAPEKVMPYEGLKGSQLGQGQGACPYLTGDPEEQKINWGLGETCTNFSCYGGSWAGFLGATVKQTNVSEILQIDCNALDFYKNQSYPTFLYYNPYSVSKSVQINISESSDLYNVLTDTFVERNVSGTRTVTIPADGCVLLVVAPPNGSISYTTNKTLINGVPVAYVQPDITRKYEYKDNLAEGCTAVASAELSPASQATDGHYYNPWISGYSLTDTIDWLYVDLGTVYKIDNVVLLWGSQYSNEYKIQASYDAVNWTDVYTTNNGNGLYKDIKFNAVNARYVRLYSTSRALLSTYYPNVTSQERWGYIALNELKVYGTQKNLAQGKSGFASSKSTTGYEGTLAFDGVTSTGWQSANTDNEWVYADLGASYPVDRVVLNWYPLMNASHYQIQVSSDATNWTTVKDITNGQGGHEDITFYPINARYVKMKGIQRANTNTGYRLRECKVYDTRVNLLNNPSFEFNYDSQTIASWDTSGSTPDADYSSTNGLAANGAAFGVHYYPQPYQVYTSQTLTGLTNGTYTLKAWVKSSGGQNSCMLYASDFDTAGSLIYQNISASSDWVQVTISNIIVKNGMCKVVFHSSDTVGGKWLFFDQVELVKNKTLAYNSSFEHDADGSQSITGWYSGYTTSADYCSSNGIAFDGSKFAVHYYGSPYQAVTYQNLSGLANGTYSLKAWVKSSGGQSVCYMYATSFDSNSTTLVQNINASSDWVQITIPSIVITNGSCQMGFHSLDNSGGNWMFFDNIEFVKQ